MGKRGTKAAKVHRQSIVRSLMARGLEQHEILDTLEKPQYAEPVMMKDGILIDNPNFCGNVKTGERVDKATISRDWNEIQEQWRKEAVEDVNEHFARQLAEIREAKRIAQAAKDRSEIRLLIQLEMKLLGTPKPEKTEIRWDDEQIGKVDRMKGLFQGMRQREAGNGHSDSD